MCPWGLSAAAVLSLAWPLRTELEAHLTEPSQLLLTEGAGEKQTLRCVVIHPRRQPAEDQSWRLSSDLAPWQKDHRFKGRVTQRDPMCPGEREAGREGGREAGKRGKEEGKDKRGREKEGP